MATRQHKVHTQLSRAAVQIFAANERMNQIYTSTETGVNRSSAHSAGTLRSPT